MQLNREKIQKTVTVSWPFLILALYILLNSILILHHENWRDEAQAWQIAKQLSLPDIFRQLKYEGHPCLWYLILFPFAKLGFPFGCIGFISLFFMAIAVWLILKKAPFCILVKVLLVFSPFFVYYYPVISRSYCLIPPLLAWLAALYPRRKEKPLWYGAALALLTQTHIFMIGLSFLLSFSWFMETVFVWRKEKTGHKLPVQNIQGLGISLASGLFLIWELLGSATTNASVDVHISSSLSSNLHRINVASQWGMDELLKMGVDDPTWKILRLLLVAGAVVLLFYSWKEASIYIGTSVMQVLMFAYIYLASPQKAMLLAHGLVFVLWIIMEEKKEVRMWKWFWQLALAVLALMATNGHKPLILNDMDQAYSSSKEMAAYIREHVPEDVPLIAASDIAVEAAAAYLPERVIWYPITENAVTFLVWDGVRTGSITYEEMLERVKKQYPDAKGIYFLCGEENNVSGWEDQLPQMQELVRMEGNASNESAILYYIQMPVSK